MLIFDQLKKDDAQLRFMAAMVACGLLILLAGLWWVQVVSAGYYQSKLETQSLRTIRIASVRGRILDRDGRALAESRPCYNIDLYLEDLSKRYQEAYNSWTKQIRANLQQQKQQAKNAAGHKLTKQEQKQLDRKFGITESMRSQLQLQSRYVVSSNLVAELSQGLGLPISFEQKEFEQHYAKARALPLPVLSNLNSTNVARFEEQSMHTPGMTLDVQSLRYYPNGTVAAHVLGYLARDSESNEGEVSDYDYRMDDFVGKSSIERLFDKELRGTAGEKSVLVNNLGYRKGETIWTPAEPGEDVVLTIDLDIQKAAEIALQQSAASDRGAVVVMNVTNGDILAMASAPTYDPNYFVQRPDPAIWARHWERWSDEELKVQINRAMYANYAPGSVFKIVVGLAALEQGVLDPHAIYQNEGYIEVGNRKWHDTAPPGSYDFDRALAKSSNSYFINYGLKPGVLARVIALGQRLHFGERTGVIQGQEARGYFPNAKDILANSWHDGNTANISIGQEKVAVTPLQVAVMISAVANGGTVLYPRLVSSIQRYGSTEVSQTFPGGRVRDNLSVSRRSLSFVYEAMRADVEREEGTGHAAAVPGLSIAGKTGTAQVEKNGHIDKSAQITWFASFAPVENPRYAVVAMVESGSSGGGTCAPIAHKVYLAIQQREQERQQKASPKPGTLAEIQ
jgi:penicillin-binding protein 2